MKKNKNFVILKHGFLTLLFSFLFTTLPMAAQDTLPYYQIPEYPENYTQGTILARLVDGLGFRYYWATEGLNADDLAYKPGPTNRTIDETLDHIYGLSDVILNAALNVPNDRKEPLVVPDTYKEKRSATLMNMKKASEAFMKLDEVQDIEVVFIRKSDTFSVPFWNLLNGPLEDAVWHCGQVVSLRRAAGNPIPSGVSVFMGTKRDENN